MNDFYYLEKYGNNKKFNKNLVEKIKQDFTLVMRYFITINHFKKL